MFLGMSFSRIYLYEYRIKTVFYNSLGGGIGRGIEVPINQAIKNANDSTVNKNLTL